MVNENSVKKLHYQDSDSNQTLREALEEYRSNNSEVLNDSSTKESEFFFIPHDVCHVLFGCSTSLEDEVVTDSWTIFGTDVSLSKFYQFVRLEGHREIIREIGLLTVVKTFIKAVPRIVKVIYFSRRMTAKWEWDDFDKHLGSELVDIRREFNITLV